MLTLCVSACGTGNYKVVTCSIPAWPVGGEPVATEMDRVCPVEKNDCPAINDWHARLYVFKQQLEANP